MKGLSPLIGGVLLVAFTLAIAGLVSQFLISQTQEQSSKAGDKGEAVVNCGNTQIKILPDSTKWDGENILVNVENTGNEPVIIPEILIFNSGDNIEIITDPKPVSGYGGKVLDKDNPLPSGSFATFNESVDYHVQKVTVRTSCPGKSSTAENDTSDGTTDFELSF